jgi:folate-binding protein YgfZ
LTSDLARLAASSGVSPPPAGYALAVGRNGKVLADLVVLKDGERWLLAVRSSASAAAAALMDHFEHHRIMEDADVVDLSAELDAWALHGPKAGAVLEAIVAAGGVGGHLDRTGLGGAVVFVPSAATSRDLVAAAVERAGGTVGDAAGWLALRLERAVPEIGEDFDDKTYPQEAGLEKTAVSFEKGCYLGQEVVFMLENRGHVNRHIAALVLDSAGVPERGAAVVDSAGTAVGAVTSSAFSPTLGRAVALAMVKVHALEHEPLTLTIGGAAAKLVVQPA